MKNVLLVTMTALLLTFLSGCTTVNVNSQRAPHYSFQPHQSWGVAAFTNNTDVPQAGSRAMSITSGVLRAKGIKHLGVFQPRKNCNELVVCPHYSVGVHEARHYALKHNIRFMMLGSVNEWQYKVGLDGEPVASISLQLLDVHRNEVVWSSVGSRTGSSHSGLSVTAQELINTMLHSL